MNRLQGEISAIETEQALSIVTVDVGGIPFQAIVIETPDTASYLRVGNTLQLIFKETAVILALPPLPTMSIANQLPVQVSQVFDGKVLSRVECESVAGVLTVIVPTSDFLKLKIKKGAKLLALIKTNEVMLSI